MGQMKEFAGVYHREGALDPTAMQRGATDDKTNERLHYAMRGAAWAAWSTIKYIPGIEDLNKGRKTTYAMESCP